LNEYEWEEGTSQDWIDAVNSVPWEEHAGAWMKAFSCERCKHCSATVIGTVIKGWSVRGVEPPAPTAYVRCECNGEHRGRPEQANGRGCGQSGEVEGPGQQRLRQR